MWRSPITHLQECTLGVLCHVRCRCVPLSSHHIAFFNTLHTISHTHHTIQRETPHTLSPHTLSPHTLSPHTLSRPWWVPPVTRVTVRKLTHELRSSSAAVPWLIHMMSYQAPDRQVSNYTVRPHLHCTLQHTATPCNHKVTHPCRNQWGHLSKTLANVACSNQHTCLLYTQKLRQSWQCAYATLEHRFFRESCNTRMKESCDTYEGVKSHVTHMKE